MVGEDSGIGEDLSAHEEIDQLYVDTIENLYDQAQRLIDNYFEQIRKGPEQYFDFVEEFGDFTKLDEITELWNRKRERALKVQRELAISSLRAVHNLLEEYRNQLAERRRFKIAYLRQYGADQFDIDPDESILEQVTVNEIVEDFWNNQVGRN